MLTAAVAPADDREARRQQVWMSGCALVLAGDPRDTQHALTVRTALEPELLQQAAHDCRGLDAAELDVFLEAMTECRNDAVAFVRAHWALHRRLAELTANPVLRDVYLAMLDIAEDRVEGRCRPRVPGALARDGPAPPRTRGRDRRGRHGARARPRRERRCRLLNTGRATARYTHRRTRRTTRPPCCAPRAGPCSRSSSRCRN